MPIAMRLLLVLELLLVLKVIIMHFMSVFIPADRKFLILILYTFAIFFSPEQSDHVRG